MRDYSRRYSSVVGQRQQVSGRNGQRSQGAAGSWRRVCGVVLACAALGLLASYWTAALARGEGAQLVREQERKEKLIAQRDAMAAQHGGFMTAKWIEAEAAKKLGLFPPNAKQIGRP